MNKVVLIKKEQSDLSNTPAGHHCRVSDESEMYKSRRLYFPNSKTSPTISKFPARHYITTITSRQCVCTEDFHNSFSSSKSHWLSIMPQINFFQKVASLPVRANS